MGFERYVAAGSFTQSRTHTHPLVRPDEPEAVRSRTQRENSIEVSIMTLPTKRIRSAPMPSAGGWRLHPDLESDTDPIAGP